MKFRRTAKSIAASVIAAGLFGLVAGPALSAPSADTGWGYKTSDTGWGFKTNDTGWGRK